jgi:hypothetical protein
MKFIKNIIQRIIHNDLPKPMGRWNIDYCNKKINNKIDLSNEDHCGPCGQYALAKLESNENKREIHDKTEKEKEKKNKI